MLLLSALDLFISKFRTVPYDVLQFTLTVNFHFRCQLTDCCEFEGMHLKDGSYDRTEVLKNKQTKCTF